MNIKSKQIIDELELVLGKFANEITNEDLNNITELKIRNFDVDGSVMEFYLEDLSLFNNLNKISFTDMIIEIDTLNYIYNSNITELNLHNCELMCTIDKPFEKIETLRVDYTDNFKEDYLRFFPNVKELVFKGYELTKELPSNIKVLNIVDTKVNDVSLIEKANLDRLYISKEEYNKDDYYKNKLNIFVYDDNNIYLVNNGDQNE